MLIVFTLACYIKIFKVKKTTTDTQIIVFSACINKRNTYKLVPMNFKISIIKKFTEKLFITAIMKPTLDEMRMALRRPRVSA